MLRVLKELHGLSTIMCADLKNAGVISAHGVSEVEDVLRDAERELTKAGVMRKAG